MVSKGDCIIATLIKNIELGDYIEIDVKKSEKQRNSNELIYSECGSKTI